MMGGQPRVEVAKPGPRAFHVLCVAVNLERRSGMDRRLGDAGRGGGAGYSGDLLRAPELRAREIGAGRDRGIKTMWGTRPSAHWEWNRVTSSCCARRSSDHERPIEMNAESQLYWWG